MFDFKEMTLNVRRTCQPLEPYKRMTSSWRHVVLRTAATGRQSWDVHLHITTLLVWQANRRRQLLHSWRLQHLLIYTALRLFVLLILLNRYHLCRPLLLTYRVTRTRGRHRHSTCSVCCNFIMKSYQIQYFSLLQLNNFNVVDENNKKTKT